MQAGILTRKVEGKSSKKFGFWHLEKSGFWREPQSEPQANLRGQKITRTIRKNTGFLIEIRYFMTKNPNNDTAGFGCAPFCRWGAFSICGVHFKM